MRKLLLLSALFALIISACKNEEPTDGAASTAVQTNVEIVRTSATGPAHTTAVLYVEGMMCAKACGGKIMQELAELNGVSETSIDYAEGRELNSASLTFDPAVVNESELIQTINSIADGKLYQVVKMEVVTYTPGSADENDTDIETQNAASVLDLTSVFRFPNVFQIIRNFLVG